MRLAAPSRFAAQRLSGRREALGELWAGFFGHAVRVEVASPETPQEAVAAKREDSRMQRSSALNHPSVARALEILDGEISEVRALGPEGSP